MWIPKCLQNAPGSGKPTITIMAYDPGWPEAYANWLKGGKPTESSEWSKGVYLLYEVKVIYAD